MDVSDKYEAVTGLWHHIEMTESLDLIQQSDSGFINDYISQANEKNLLTWLTSAN